MAKNLNQILKDFIKDRITMSEEDRKKKVEAVRSNIDRLITAMKNINPLFKELYQNIYYAGSFYDGLRVSEANEYDLNIRLKLPFKSDDIEIVTSETPKGYVKYKLTDTLANILSRHEKWPIYKKLDDILDATKMYLSQIKVNRWLVGIVDKAIKKNPEEFKNFDRSTNGPATTLRIQTDVGKLDVDLVPVVELLKLPDTVRSMKIMNEVPPKKIFCFIVPKPVEGKENIKDRSGTLWRVSIPEVERHLMDSKHCLKPLIKIFKAVRDNYDWKGIASYYIKTMFLFQVEKQPEREFWKEADMGKLFKMMLTEFSAVMTKPELNHFFFDNMNLLSGIRKDTAYNIKGRLEKILKASESDITKLPDLLRNKTPDRPPTPAPRTTLLQPRPILIPTQRTVKIDPPKEPSGWKCIIM